jgi:hypothetical protein
VRRHKALQRQIVELREQFQVEDAALARDIQQSIRWRDGLAAERAAMAESRYAFKPGNGRSSKDGRR